MKNLILNENADILDKCLPLNESLFDEIYNKRLWIWLYEFGLISSKNERKYCYNKNGNLYFDSNVIDNAFGNLNKNILKKIYISAKFARKAFNLIDNFNDLKILNIYEKEKKINYSKLKNEEKIRKIGILWEVLIDNFKYAILGDLIIQYNLKIKILDKYKEDFVAKRYNAIMDLEEKNITKNKFNQDFGFLSKYDYDFSSPRYEELKSIPIANLNRLEESIGNHNFRDFVKFQNIRLISLLRKLFISLKKKDIYYYFYNEIVDSNCKISKKIISERKINFGTSVKNDKYSQKFSVLNGNHVSGNGIIKGEVFVLSDFDKVTEVPDDAILIVKTLHPDLVVLFSVCKCIISEVGGKLSHVAIVGRERGFPIITNVENCTSFLTNYDKVVVDVKRGTLRIIDE